MKIKISDFITELTLNNSSNRANFIFFPKKPLEVMKELAKISDININSFIREECLDNNYFDKGLSLLQNIKFHCMISGKNQDEFLENNSLSKQYKDYSLKGFKKIPKSIWEMFEILLFLELNKVCLIEKQTFFKLINSFDEIQKLRAYKSIENKQLFFFSNNSNVVNIKEYFDLFLLINDKAYKIFKNAGPFMSEAKQIEQK